MTEPYEQTQPTGDGGVIVPPAPDWPPRALDADGDGQPDYREPEVPTQVAHPWRATMRTLLAILLGVGIVAPVAWLIVREELERQQLTLPPGVVAAVAYGLAVLAVITSSITRIMAIPQVSDLLTRVGIGPTPNPDAE